ncbi:helix-turn-helix transcriptional regulator [Leifsonia sp. 21MFCrub1.1]|uniref:helix-turn-helix transcriptional regulator n=1 Tax=Leifsonia sp. 21MFCrub1.1 TaxID=1798223 RepID=UPI000892A0E4|nr:helix-turn-helix transcriptional regulator [Leifsonia sp. 21MFCrub1.1]SEB14274.1 Helix-turn-helix domain-containing protein [Leifsonia sp. 21MFCrub1.1]
MGVARNTTPLGEYLRARREQVQPHQVGLEVLPGRRVPGLRREEVAELAGMSPDYYLRIEQGRDRRPSEQVLSALARALLLDEDSFQYLVRLARPRPFVRRVPHDGSVSRGVAQLLAQWSHTPAYVTDANQNILAANPLVDGLGSGVLVPGTNMLITSFESYAAYRANSDPANAEDVEIITEWEGTLREMIAAMRYHGDPDDPQLQEIVGALSARHQFFRTVWAEHDAKPYVSGVKRAFVAPLGWVDFRWQTLEVPRSGGQFITMFFGDPGSAAAQAIAYLAALPPRAQAVAGGVESASLNRAMPAIDALSTGAKTMMASSS